MNKDRGHVLYGARLRSLLYVEDHPASMAVVEKLIARRPELRLLRATSGHDGVAVARQSLPDVILMDINLPDISGFKALELLRADPATARIPVIALSVNTLPLNVASGVEAGFFRYLTKPIKLDEFMDTLDAALAIAARKQAQGG